ncbi:MAG: GGDEF domain-containing protein [Pseudomonadota bacterium]
MTDASPILDAHPVATIVIDAFGIVVSRNLAWANLRGSFAAADMVSLDLGVDAVAHWTALGGDEPTALAAGVAAVLGGRRRNLRIDHPPTSTDGLRVRFDLAGLPGGGCIVACTDITVECRRAEDAERRARLDPLTGVLNNRAFQSQLARRLRDLPSDGLGLLVVDLDGFKAINDRHGHVVGDRVLEVLARRLVATLRPAAVVGRLGGDEFLILVPDVATDAALRAVIGRVRAAIEAPVAVATVAFTVRASVGGLVLDAGDASQDTDDVLARADRRMYEDKRRRSAAAAGRSLTPA